MESDEEVLQVCAAIIFADALLEKPKRRRKKWVNDYLLERVTKGSYGSLLTKLSLKKDRRMAANNVNFFLNLLKSYVSKIVSQTLVNFGICNFF